MLLSSALTMFGIVSGLVWFLTYRRYVLFYSILSYPILSGPVWSGLVWSGLVWSGLVWPGLAWWVWFGGVDEHRGTVFTNYNDVITFIPLSLPALLPQQEYPEVLKQQRRLELLEKQKQYNWGTLEGFDGLPGYVHAAKHSDIPRNSQFTNEASRSFHANRLRAVASLGLSHLYTLFETWDDFDDFKKLFAGWTSEVPKYAEDDRWMDDRVFGMQFLNGCNPCTIRRCEKLPSNFPVTNDHVSGQLDRGLTLKQEIKVYSER